ncbi:probable protein phosphatase 2C 40 [Nicotiana sylvestris]|uniref:Probable protein phosphatase 2C 40 n=2 Tax=Nicotiana TaxID=4085 RepID=A0A1S4BZF1_TOBAC|nr:PREDICTED: probable protein phosphatase 2C 40 [Nicotiana sylvestris]XP_009780605.1 PREDICTED: probable protein phosphatase 2C 40 [Nicotiana sylvestris]XP_016494284.1 PREDICTED: probable protein phosphatase 2C 40 [Nicotiana tabacum]XP_016494285.1 PREDICTED: probable protein phosphatase 2C 40 [Nicotiana tabacum]
MMGGQAITDPGAEIKVSFGYHCNSNTDDSGDESDGIDMRPGTKLRRANSSFSCLSGAALSANATLANTNICNGLLGAEILPALDSPTSFRRIPSSPSFSKLDLLSSSFQSSLSNLSCSPSSPSELAEDNSSSMKSSSESFFNATEVKIAGGAAGEDRVQAVCSEENDSLFCAIYDGFNGRDAADFLAGTLYETIRHYLSLLDWELERDSKVNKGSYVDCFGNALPYLDVEKPCTSFKQKVLNSLEQALTQAENDFLHMVEQEMDDRPDLVSIGSCVLVALLLGKNLYVLNAGDSRAVLATCGESIVTNSDGRLQAVQLTVSHTVDNESERIQLLKNHPEDHSTIVGGKVKGKLKVTRALGVGYLKKKSMNDALMGILRVRNLISPPYISVQPSLTVHEISSSDHFVVLGSDGLFDFFNNDEVVKLVHSYIQRYPFGDPAKFLLEQLVIRAADCAGFSKEELMSIPAGRRRKYHDDVTVIVIILGMNKRTSKASTRL